MKQQTNIKGDDMTKCKITEIPEALFPLVNNEKREVTIYCSRGRVEKISIMRGMYRLYINADKNSGEYRYTQEQASEIEVSLV